MKENIDIYGKVLSLFETVDEAIQYVEENCYDDHEMAVRLLNDILSAILGIKDSSDLLLKRLDLDVSVLNKGCEAIIQDLHHLLRAYENYYSQSAIEMIRKSVVLNIHLWRKTIVERIGSNVAS